MKVLVVDDEKGILQLYSMLFRKFSIEVIAFDNTKEAIKFLLRNEADVIVSDFNLPSCNGVDFFRKLKSDNIFNGAFILVTGADIEEEGLIRQGIAKVYSKPISYHELAQYVLSIGKN